MTNKYSPITDDQLTREGISFDHAAAFVRVAANRGDLGTVKYKSVILTRTPGEACLKLLAEGYDAKGFHVKGKSCTWGPMSGFICAEPLFNKKGKAGAIDNLKSHYKSLVYDFEAALHAYQKAQGKVQEPPLTSRLIPIEISDARRLDLIKRGVIQATTTSDTDVVGKTTSEDGIAVEWRLTRASKQDPRWRLLYKPTLPPLAIEAADVQMAEVVRAKINDRVQKEIAAKRASAGWHPVLALTNPHPFYADADDYRHAITGDFDLFAVWPEDNSWTATVFGVRVGGMQQDATANKDIYAREGASLIGGVTGNISGGIYDVGVALNLAMGSPEVPNRVFHSDEAGRPSMNEVDASVAFHPDGSVRLLPANSKEFAEFVKLCAGQGYRIYLNSGWVKSIEGHLGGEAKGVLAKVHWQQSEIAAS